MAQAPVRGEEWPLAADARLVHPSSRRQVWRRFRRHRLGVVGLCILAGLAVFSFVGPLLTPFDPNGIPLASYAASRDLGPLSRAPDGFHVLGTDRSGRDCMTRLMHAGRVSLGLAIVVTTVTQLLGLIVGSISGYFGRWIDSFLMRCVDFLLTLPTLPMLLVLSALLPMRRIPGGSISVVALVLIAFGWLGSARLVRGMMLSLRSREFTLAARSLGASDWQIILRHMLPNALSPVLVSATFGMSSVVVTEAALSFLGFGVRPPSPSWGNMLNEVQGAMVSEPLLVLYPGLAIFLTSLSLNFVGDAMRDALDPRSQA